VRSGRLPRFQSAVPKGEARHQAHLPAQETVPPACPRLSPPHELTRWGTGGAKPTSQGPPAPHPV